MGALMSVTVSAARPAVLHGQEGQGWKGDWNVKCTWANKMLVKAMTTVLDEVLEELFPAGVPEDATERIVESTCSDRPSAIGEASPAALARLELRATSHWLRELGFQAPIVTPAPNPEKYLAWIDEFLFLRRAEDGTFLTDEGGKAIVDPGARYKTDGSLFFTPISVLSMKGSEAHELFHAVQNATGPTFMRTKAGSAELVVVEGTAEAVALAWARKPESLAERTGFSRVFDDALFEFREAGPQGKEPAYGTAAFWLEVGRQLRATDWIEYLSQLIGRLDGGSTVAAVDRALTDLFEERGIDDGGLYHAFPEFVRHVLRDPDSAADRFELVRSVPVAISPGQDSVVETRNDRVEKIAANAYKVRVAVPPGRRAGLRIQFENDGANLHLIVDDRRYNRYPDEAHPNRRRNEFATSLYGDGRDTTFFVRVANVDRPAPSTRDGRYTLRVTLTLQDAVARVGGGSPLSDVLFTYIDASSHPGTVVRDAWPQLMEQYADHAGLDETTEEGRAARAQIREAMGGALAGTELEVPEGETDSAGAAPMAIVTVFDDDARSFATLRWEGGGELLGTTVPVRVMYGQGLHDVVYSEMKSMGHQIALLDDPESLADWGDEARTLTMPGALELALKGIAETGDPAGPVIAEKLGGLGRLLEGLPFLPPQDDDTPAHRGQDSFGELFEGAGTLRMEHCARDGLRGEFEFSATGPRDGGPQRTVSGAGGFTAIPGPIVRGFLTSECDDLPPLEPEDDYVVTPNPAVYPPGFDDAESDYWCLRSPLHFAACACGGYMLANALVFDNLDPFACICDVVEAISPDDSPEFCSARPEPEETEFPDPVDEEDRTVQPPPCGFPGGPPCPDREEECEAPDCPPPPPSEEEDECEAPDCPPPPPSEEEDECEAPPCPPPAEEETDPDPGAPTGEDPDRDPARGRDPTREPAAGDPGGEQAGGVRGSNLTLDFLEEGEADVRSEPQRAAGRGSVAAVSASADAFALNLHLDAAEVAGCDFSQSVRMGLQMLASGRRLDGELRLNATGERLELELSSGVGVIIVRADGPGAVRLRPGGVAGVRGDVNGGDLELRLDQGTFACEGLVDFSFRLTDAP